MIRNILEYLEETTKQMPGKNAFCGKDSALTFLELQQKAKEIGSFLVGYKKRNTPIAVMMEKTPMCIAAFLGCVYSGNFYTPIDSTMPKERILSILDTLQPEVLLIDEKSKKLANNLGYTGEMAVVEEILGCDIQEDALANIRKTFIDADPLYAVFTSGSTGVPKGVVIPHHATINLIEWYTETFSITEKEIIGNQAPFYFDSSVKDIYVVLKTGATMEIIPKQLGSFPIKLMEYVAERQINYVDWVPSSLCMVANSGTLELCAPECLQKIMFVGEVMPTKQFNMWKAKYPNAMFANIYGPTEATVDCTYYIVDREFADDEPLPIGYPCENTDIFILNGDRLAEADESGELCIRGRCLAFGYYNNPEKTEEAFIQNPLNPHYPEKIYKTGDIAKYNEYGEIIFMARKDHQIKHMGHRIELGEIETAVNSIDLVETGACIYDEESQRIVLFYCGAEATQAYILKKLRDKVPKYMFPNVMMLLEEMPHSLNGKIDRLVLKEYYENRE
ncbi:amino acid adenylation domain-containing protein [Chakrabartyella piscis]|uniref:amino acid adenylation domain-containing protein n=1 Tax=Chakrabartyella piscis TaxID=2918914 RepID=UPI002958B856|nr:amino acid adenylation domain-containing protein [Chakrabartyella piscis]